ncbi:MAG: class I SAM-dependent methyltransferase [Chloroflexi bacterium]|nr:class I SAM-dependent methyltransferase [Chloroflexota bacterium]MDA1239512.1 class I SAM-dependent methyltransferase [Chloroflexota bacterium]
MPEPYYHDMAEEYAARETGLPGDVEFYTTLAQEAHGLVVELGVGTGRIAIPSALAGARVLGIDVEPAMLEVARRLAAEAGVGDRLVLAEGDMRDFQVPEPAALVTIPFRAFLHNLTVDDQLSTLAACHRALRPGGRLALNVFNPSLPLITRWMARGPRHWEPYGGARGLDDGTQARNEYRPTAQVATTHLRVRDAAGRWRKTSYRVRYVYRFEMEHLLQRAGFEVESLFGDFAGGAFEETSTEMIWVARRP